MDTVSAPHCSIMRTRKRVDIDIEQDNWRNHLDCWRHYNHNSGNDLLNK